MQVGLLYRSSARDGRGVGLHHMLFREFMVPLGTLCACVIVSIVGLDRLCLFHQTYQSMVAKLESERWLLEQCSDPHFFSKMHQHSNLCFQV